MGSDLAKGRDGSPSRPGGGSAWTPARAGAHLVKMLAVSLFGLSSLIVGFSPRVDPDLFTKTESDISTGRRPLRFDAESAWSTTREFVTQFPNRVFGSLESRQATGFLTDRLAAAGYQVEYTHYDGRIGGGARAGRNVLAFKQGETDEIIAITAHFDSARPTVQGASKNGAAVGTLLELAGIFSKEKTRRSLLFAFTDGGEWGSTGARDLSLNYAGKDRIVAVLSLDHVASGDLAGLWLGTTGQLRGSTPSWLRAAALKVVNFDGTPVAVARDSNLSSVLSAAFLISQSDQGPFLRAGIPAINLGSYSRDEKREAEILRSSEDTIDKLKVESIGRYGLAAEGIVRLIDGVERIPREASSGRLVYWLYFIAVFYCLLCVLYPHLRANWGNLNRSRILRGTSKNLADKARRSEKSGVYIPVNEHFRGSCNAISGVFRGALRELLALSLTCIPLFLVYFGIRLAYAARQLPLYDLYPAVAKDPAMLHPQLKPLLIIAAAVLFFAGAVWVIGRYFLREWGASDFPSAKTALLTVLTAVVVLAMFYNLFWAMLFLFIPAAAYTEVKISSNRKRIVNFALVLGSALPALLVLGWLAQQLGVGWNFYWYQTLALATGLFSPYAFFMSAVTIAIGIRLLVLSRTAQK